MYFKKSLFVILFAFGTTVFASPVNVNKASVEEISAALVGIGPAKASAISKHCRKITCKKPDDLLEVKGIGEKTLAKIKSDLRFK